MIDPQASTSIEESLFLSNRGEVYRTVINHTEKLLIEKALRRTNGNQIVAARLLGLNRNTLRTKIRKLQINKLQFRA